MKQKLTHNLNLKVLAVLFSIIIWIIVVNIDDPVKSVQFNDVQVTVTNESVLTDENLVYDIKEDQRTVDVTVSGRRSVIEDISKDNINVIADLNKLKEDNTVELKVTSNKYSGDIDTMKPEIDSIQLEIEELKRIQKAIGVDPIGKPAYGYIEGSYSLSLNRVRIEGPVSVIDTIQSAMVQIDVEGATNNVSASSPIILYDALGNPIDTSRIKMNIDTINVSQEILYTKTVNIVCNPSGIPEEGYKANGTVDINPSEIKIAGPKTVLDNIIQITIPSDKVNINDQKTTYKTMLNVLNYLPSGVDSAEDDFKGSVSVSVGIEKEINKTQTIFVSKISMDNIPEGYSAEILDNIESVTDNRVVVSMWGLNDELADVSAADIGLEADFDKMLENYNITSVSQGVYNVPLKIVLPDGLRTDSVLKVRMRLTKDET